MIHYYVVRFVQSSDGKLVAAEREQKTSVMAALSCACAYASENSGAVAFSRQDDRPSLGGQPGQIIAGVGLLPEEIESYLTAQDE